MTEENKEKKKKKKPMKKPNGYGSVYKLTGRRRKPWVAVVTLGIKDGKQNKKFLGTYTEKVDAEMALVEYKKDPRKFRDIPTVQMIYDIFTNNLKDKSASTMEMYRTAWNHVKRYADDKITEIKALHIQDVIDELIDDNKSYSLCHKVKILSSQLFKIAMQNDYIDKNYAQFVKLQKKPEPDNSTFSDEEVKTIEKAAKTDDVAKIMLIMIYTAMRPSELLTTTKFNVNLKENYIISGMKTDAGTDRYIPIHPKIKKYVRYFYNLAPQSEYLITENGYRVSYGMYLDRHNLLVEKLKITPLRPHKCRKTGATIYAKSGMDPLSLQAILGHADFNTTSKYYIGDISELLQEAVKKAK